MYDKEKILQLYESGLGSKKVAEIIGCSYITVIRTARRAGVVRRRGPTENTLKAKGNFCKPFSKNFISYLDGLLISDGSITKPNGCSVCSSYRQHCINLQWLKIIQSKFLLYGGIKSKIDVENYTNKIWNLRTLHYDQITTLRNRWYHNDVKIIPKDLDFSKDFMKNWIYGDGSLNKKTLTLATDSFSENDINWLVEKLNASLGITFRKNYRKESVSGEPQFRLTLCFRDGLSKLYDYIGKCDVACFSYKWYENKLGGL